MKILRNRSRRNAARRRACVRSLRRIGSTRRTGGNPSQPSQLSQRTYTYDDLDRLATDGDTAYTYDAAGNRLAKTDAGGTVSYTLGARQLMMLCQIQLLH